MIVYFIALCGGNLAATDDGQTISSPNYQSSLSNQLRCRWVIDAPVRSQVRLTVTNMAISSNSDCADNFIEFRDSPMVSMKVKEGKKEKNNLNVHL